MVEVTRDEFEQATASLVEETLDIVQRALDTAELKRPGLQLDEVLLVGGSSRMPMIQESLSARFGWELRLTDFDLAVAKGAAIYAQPVEVTRLGSVEGPATALGTPAALGDGDRATLEGESTQYRAIRYSCKILGCASETFRSFHDARYLPACADHGTAMELNVWT
jgi:cell division ATPase FtsA